MLETRALVADDDAAISHVLGECLRRIPIPQIDHATDGEAALALFVEHKHALVVLDLYMPKMSGLDVLRRIRTIDPRTQVVIVAAVATKEQAIEALNLHAFGLLELPFSPHQIETMLAEAYSQYQQLAGGAPAHEAEIAALYEQLATLSAALERSPDDAAVRQTHEQCLRRLRDMQRQEAEFASQLFRQNLALKKGSGYASIEAARRLLDRDKRPA
jgi:DNA-binding NtrC family response regulator